MNDGMVKMNHRTTFALDEATTRRLKHLAARWRVSQAEVVRRSLEEAERRSQSENPDPAARLCDLHKKGAGLTPAAAEHYLSEVREDRKEWRGR